MELSNAAAQCYALAGRLRNAGLMRSDVADALASRGNLSAAAALYERQTRLFLAETWYQLAGLLLRKLARTQQVSSSLRHQSNPATRTWLHMCTCSNSTAAGLQPAYFCTVASGWPPH